MPAMQSAASEAESKRAGPEARVVRYARNQRERDVRRDRPLRLPRDQGDPRSPAVHDKDRVYYSAAFRRLAGVTQVVTPSPGGYVTHNRLTHSLKVAQVARSIAESLLARKNRRVLADLGGMDIDVVEAAALAHDLGHPPCSYGADVGGPGGGHSRDHTLVQALN